MASKLNRIRAWLFNLWLDHWYLPRHPHHGMVIPLAVLYKMVHAGVREALMMTIPEMEWLRQVSDSDITPSGHENRIPFRTWGAA